MKVTMKNVLVTLLLLGATLALLTDKGMSAQGNSSNASNAIEEKKLALEYQKLEVERSKAIWSAMATIVPLLAALGTLIYSVWSFSKQTTQTATLQKDAATETARLQNESAKLQFEIKAAEIAFAGKTPEAVTNRANVLKTIFGARLPENFPPPLDPKQHGGGKESPEEKLFFLELLLKYPDKETEIIKGWEVLFGDTWLDRVKPVLLKKEGTFIGKPEDLEKAAPEKPNDAITTPSLPESAARESADNNTPGPSTQPPHPPEVAKPPVQQQPETPKSTDQSDPKK